MKRSKLNILLLIAPAAVGALIGCGSSITVPTSYQQWNAKDGTFSIDYPTDWKAEGGGKQGVQWAEFTQGGAQIRVTVDVSSSLVGDIAASATQGLPSGLGGEDTDELGVDLAPVAAAHKFNMESTTSDFSGYKEGKAIPFQSKLGDGRKSPFQAKGSLGTNMRGYRATVLAHSRGIKVICICPEQYWEKLSPAFDKILEGLAMGTTS